MELRSKQLADLVGVSVRTLRHYHQIGLLPEPERSANGYRLYDLDHVLQLLRIKRLANLGLSLDTIKAILGNLGGVDARGTLEQLDHDLDERIRDLQNKRRTIRTILQSGETLDVLPEFAEYINTITGFGAGQDSIETDKLLIEIINGIEHPEEIQTLHELLRFITQEPYATLFNDLDIRTQAIDGTSSEQTIERLAQDYASAIERLRQQFAQTHDGAQWPDDPLTALLIESLTRQQLNDQQLHVVHRIMELVEARQSGRTGGA